MKTVERCIVSVHSVNPTSTELSDWSLKSLAKIPKGKEMILVIFGDVQKVKTAHGTASTWCWVPETHPEYLKPLRSKTSWGASSNGAI
jgi:hypothetical protein